MDTTEVEIGKKNKEKGVEGENVEKEDVEEEDEENIKRRISCHPLYGLLLETHLDCVKVVLGDIDDAKSEGERGNENHVDNRCNVSTVTQSDLDNFMEVYCRTLKKLKNAMEEPVNEMISFFNCMYFELEQLRRPPHEYAVPMIASHSPEAETIETAGESTEFKTF
ncbi:KNOX2 [Dillenia turbinata]|uniref:KNOX2 n=1 Tax=Dillenia turbinata TaxID=194707 RepID=A0AAN8V2B8_9MAGN